MCKIILDYEWTVVRLNIQVLQGSAATDLRRGGRFYSSFFCSSSQNPRVEQLIQESRAVTRKPRDAAAVLFGLTFADNTHYKFKE